MSRFVDGFCQTAFLEVFGMLINVQKNFLENSDFKVAFKTVFWSGISNKFFFSNQKFSFLNVIKCHFWPLNTLNFYLITYGSYNVTMS